MDTGAERSITKVGLVVPGDIVDSLNVIATRKEHTRSEIRDTRSLS